MKKVVCLLLLSGPLWAFTPEEMAKRMVVTEIERYSEELGVDELMNVDYKGRVNEKYLFSVKYLKSFCWDTNDEERMNCAVFLCESEARLNTKAFVEFETETARKKCSQVPNSSYTQPY
jgi:hypothetical protein